MNVDPSEVHDAVSVFSALGYSSRMSFATIKTQKNIKKLEDEYVRLRLTESKFNKICEKFPTLAEIKFVFTLFDCSDAPNRDIFAEIKKFIC